MKAGEREGRKRVEEKVGKSVSIFVGVRAWAREIDRGRKDEFILRFCVDQDIEKQLAEERERERGERER